jgi:hypothetical protein
MTEPPADQLERVTRRDNSTFATREAADALQEAKLFIDDFTRQAGDGSPLAIWLAQ